MPELHERGAHDPGGGGLMFERFTEASREVVQAAERATRRADERAVAPCWLLVGVAADPGPMGKLLRGHGIDPDRAYIWAKRARRADGPTGVSVTFTKEAKRAFDLALREALGLGSNYIGVEHILLGLVRDPEYMVAMTLRDLGGASVDWRDEIMGLIIARSGVL